jgi:HEAT repeat protein
MDLDKLAQIVEDMAIQHEYPGYDVRSLKMGLPQEVTKAPAKLFNAALKHENALVRLAALRWFWERPGVAKQYTRVIADLIDDGDEWVRMEAIRVIERIGTVEEKIAVQVAQRLTDEHVEVRKASAKALGKLGSKAQPVIDLLRKASEDSDHEVRWKAQKALRQLGAYVA